MNRWLVTNLEFSGASWQENVHLNYRFECDLKFSKDQIFNAKNELLILDGCTLNRKELLDKEQLLTIEDYCRKYHETLFWNNFRGPFSGCHVNIVKKELIAYTNQTGDTFVFWYSSGENIIISNDFNLIITVLKENNITYTYNKMAELFLLNYGFMLDDSTFINEIKRLQAGTYISVSASQTAVNTYHTFTTKEKAATFDEATDLVDAGFRKAVGRCFDKDLEYGFQNHLADISAGLDSRMVNWVARDMGYDNIVNISYSQWKSDENKYAQKVSNYLNNIYLHMALDCPKFIRNVDLIVNMNYGLSVYFGLTGGIELLSDLNMQKFGLEHSGQIGDVIIGTFGRNPDIKNFLQTGHKYSDLLNTEFNLDLSRYENDEIFNLYTRGFNGALSSHAIRREWIYTVSPFLDVDFIELCLSIPYEYRKNHKLYWHWIEKYYAQAAQLPSTRIKKMQIKHYAKKLLFYKRGNSMNPFDFWYQKNPLVRSFIEEYYNSNIKFYEAVVGDIQNVDAMFKSENAIDKCMAINVLAILKRYFC